MSEQVNWVSLCSHALTKLCLNSEKKRKHFFPSDQNVQILAFRSQCLGVSFVQKVSAIIYFAGFVGIHLPERPLATASVAVLLFSEELNGSIKTLWLVKLSKSCLNSHNGTNMDKTNFSKMAAGNCKQSKLISSWATETGGTTSDYFGHIYSKIHNTVAWNDLQSH